MKKAIALSLVVFSMMLMPAVAFAASPWTEQTTYAGKVKGKLDFGFKNFLGGWTEFYTEPRDYHKEGKNVAEGVLKGIWNAVIFTAGGILHVVTFPITNLDIPLPDNGVSL